MKETREKINKNRERNYKEDYEEMNEKDIVGAAAFMHWVTKQ